MGEQLKPTALNVVLETIQNRVAANRLAGRYTWVFVDEVYLFFKYYYSAQFLYKCWKLLRKYCRCHDRRHARILRNVCARKRPA